MDNLVDRGVDPRGIIDVIVQREQLLVRIEDRRNRVHQAARRGRDGYNNLIAGRDRSKVVHVDL
jgi:hypothetical protein